MADYVPNPEMVDDMEELCICCAKALALYSEKYNTDPRILGKLFIEVFKKIFDDLDKK